MKANELRIGNLLMFTDFPARKERVICGADISYAEKEPDWLDAFWTPIPLTEELLLRFGFVDDLANGFDLNGIHIEFILGVGFVFYIDGVFGNSLVIESVHQLQNLYFALTGQELELKP
jgi:hypothetical protein